MYRIALVLLLSGCSTPMVGQVNQSVNQSMIYQNEKDDVWNTHCPSKGDCEDFALCKARKLIEQGYDPHNLSLMICNRGKTPHAVLVVRENPRKSVIFDSLSPALCEPIYYCNLGSGKVSVGGDYVGGAQKCEKAASELNP